MPRLALAPLFALLLAACDADISGTSPPGPPAGAADRSPAADDNAPLRAQPPSGTASPETVPKERPGDMALTINWDDLLPEGELERLEELYAAAYSMSELNHFGGQAPQIGTFNVEEALIGQTIRMPGYILPLDYEARDELTEFLLVPYFGACVHTPPPPPNQIVYVTTGEPVDIAEVWAPVWVTGVLSADRHDNEMGDAAYTLDLIAHEPYERRR